MDNLSPGRICTKCGVWKPFSEFHRHKASSGGRYPRCKACKREDDRRYQRENRPKIREQSRRYAEQNRESISEYQRRYYEENKEKINESNRRYYYENQDRARTWMREYRKSNPQIIHVLKRNYHARKMKASGTYSFGEVWRMAEDQDHLCAYCEVPLFGAFHVEHMVPLSRGGANDWSNLAITCALCNARKGTMTVEEFIMRMRESERRAG